MAKGNLFLGFARGSVGDVTFYRSEGEQISRSRNRHPYNPRSARQAIQRAVNSSVSRIYAAGQVLFDHSFQGFKAGKENQRQFMKINNRLLRQMVLSDLANNTDNARLGVPGVSVAVPCPGIMVSDGNYPVVGFKWVDGHKAWEMEPPLASETVAAYCARVGLVPGDIFTFGALSLDNNESVTPAWEDASGLQDHSVWPSGFQWQQLMVKDTVTTDQTVITGESQLSVIFENFVSSGELDLESVTVGEEIALDTMTMRFSDDGCIFLIRSKYGEDLRSTSFLMPAQNTKDYGIKSSLVVAAWTNPAALQDPDLILDGSEFVDTE